MEKSESIKEICKALMQFHSEVGKVKKSATNPFFKSRYANLPSILDVIEEPLITAGLSFVQFPSNESGLTTILMHESGEYLQAEYIMRPSKNDPQGLGSAITYQRRYALGAILGLNTEEDDDGTKASEPYTVKDAIKEIEKAASVEMVTSLWSKGKAFQKDPKFIAAVTAKGEGFKS